jgi:hypothetical protein
VHARGGDVEVDASDDGKTSIELEDLESIGTIEDPGGSTVDLESLGVASEKHYRLAATGGGTPPGTTTAAVSLEKPYGG